MKIAHMKIEIVCNRSIGEAVNSVRNRAAYNQAKACRLNDPNCFKQAECEPRCD